jgi:ABC-type transport system substrate-binding protein
MLYELLKTVPDAWLYRVPSLGWTNYGVYLRLDKAPFNDVRVRQALSMAINRDIVMEIINRGDASLYGPFPWVQAGYTKRDDYSYANLGPNYAYNPAQAKKLLAEAGYPNGFEITLEWGEFRGTANGCGSFTATPQTLVFQSPIVPCLVISLFLQKAVAMVVEPWASLRIWPGDCVDTPVVRGSPSTRRNRH